jgi:hypothetical protein
MLTVIGSLTSLFGYETCLNELVMHVEKDETGLTIIFRTEDIYAFNNTILPRNIAPIILTLSKTSFKQRSMFVILAVNHNFRSSDSRNKLLSYNSQLRKQPAPCIRVTEKLVVAEEGQEIPLNLLNWKLHYYYDWNLSWDR